MAKWLKIEMEEDGASGAVLVDSVVAATMMDGSIMVFTPDLGWATVHTPSESSDDLIAVFEELGLGDFV